MDRKNSDLHGSAPEHANTALLLIDVITDLDYSGGDRLLEPAIRMADRIVALKRRAAEAGIPTIYVNDNFGKWRSDLAALVKHCLHDGVRGEPVVERLHPEERDYFVLKPKHSGFFSTTLETLLGHLGVNTLILTGLTTDQCVLFTANDAYLRDYHLYIPADCVAAIDPDWGTQALNYMKRNLDADLTPSTELDLAALGEAHATATSI